MELKHIQQQVAQTKKRRLFILLINLVILGVISIVLMVYFNQSKITLNELQLSEVEFGDFEVKVVANGQFKSRTPSLVTVKQEGVVQEISVEQGQFVEAGTLLMKLSNDNLLFKRSQLQTRLHNTQLEYELKNARLALEVVQQEAEVARLAGESDVLESRYLAQQQLAKEDIVSTLDLMAARVNWQNIVRQHDLAVKTLAAMEHLHEKENTLAYSKITDVKNEIDALERDIGELKLIASEAGQIQKVNAQLGEKLTLGAAAIELSKSDDLQFVAQVPERDAQRIQNLSPANIRVDNVWLKGQVERVSPNVNNGFVNVFVHFTAEDGLLLRQDLSATVEITTSVVEQTFFTDRRIAQTEQSYQDVWVFEPQNQTLTKRTLHIGTLSQQKIVILDGVSSGELLVSFEQSKHWRKPPTVIP